MENKEKDTEIILPPITSPPDGDNPRGATKSHSGQPTPTGLSLRARPQAMYPISTPLLNGWRKCQAIFPSSGTPHPPRHQFPQFVPQSPHPEPRTIKVGTRGGLSIYGDDAEAV